jgi:hypothetical protein
MATRTDPSSLSTTSGSKARVTDAHAKSDPSELISSTESKVVTEPLSDAQRRELIAVAAYYLAQSRHFEPGHADEDWLEAEAQIERLTALIS